MDSVIEGTSAAAEALALSDHQIEQIMNLYCTIFRAPAHIRYSGGSYFEPKLVSIGPYYHGRENLKLMEALKQRCISDLLNKHPDGPNIDHSHEFDRFLILAQGFYKEYFLSLGDSFVRMLFVDSCFIIRIILSLFEEVQEMMGSLDVNIKEVRSDLLLLENQIPLFFIEKVYNWLFPLTDNPTFPPFKTVLEPFICLDMPWRINNSTTNALSEAAHLLDLYWRCSSSSKMNEQLNNFRRSHSKHEQPSCNEIHLSINVLKVVANASVLHQKAGIKFEELNDKGHEDGHNVTFSNGIMRMPCLKINPIQTTLLINLITFENSILPPSIRHFSSYMKFMDSLIDSEKDVEFLQQCGVIYNTLSTHMMAATFFNDIGNLCLTDNNASLFSDLYKNVHKYYHSSWNRRWASLRHNYFSSPWAGISVVAGVTLLILSALQTFYTIYGYYKPKN